MTEPTLSAAALRGAVDLSSLGKPTPPSSAGGAAGSGSAGAGGIRVDATDDALESILQATTQVPALAVLWSSAHDGTEAAVDNAVQAAAAYPGRVRVVAIDIQVARQTAAAFQVQQIPVTFGLVAGRPIPAFPGVEPAEAIRGVVDQILQLAERAGITGTFEVTEGEVGEAPVEPELPAHIQTAYDAIDRGDFDAAAEAYRGALAQNPGDTESSIGLAQVELLRRTTGVDHIAARRAAADDPTDIDKGILVADLDVLGGHVEDAFLRLIDLVKVTADDDRQRVRKHLLELFDVVGAHDERVVKARRSLMSALF